MSNTNGDHVPALPRPGLTLSKKRGAFSRASMSILLDNKRISLASKRHAASKCSFESLPQIDEESLTSSSQAFSLKTQTLNLDLDERPKEKLKPSLSQSFSPSRKTAQRPRRGSEYSHKMHSKNKVVEEKIDENFIEKARKKIDDLNKPAPVTRRLTSPYILDLSPVPMKHKSLDIGTDLKNSVIFE